MKFHRDKGYTLEFGPLWHTHSHNLRVCVCIHTCVHAHACACAWMCMWVCLCVGRRVCFLWPCVCVQIHTLAEGIVLLSVCVKARCYHHSFHSVIKEKSCCVSLCPSPFPWCRGAWTESEYAEQLTAVQPRTRVDNSGPGVCVCRFLFPPITLDNWGMFHKAGLLCRITARRKPWSQPKSGTWTEVKSCAGFLVG